MNLYTPDLSGYKDWRKPENRIEAFSRVAYTRMVEGDLDHHHSGRVIASEMNLTKEQKMIYCLLFGQSYRNHWAMIVLQEFPDILNVDTKHIREWHDKNWKRAFYAKDTKWGLRKFPDFVESIKTKIGNNSVYDHFEKLSTVGSKSENFYSLNNGLRELFGIGRMTAWLAQQTIYEFFDFDIDHWDLQLYDDTWSQYDSMCYLYDRLDIAGTQLAPNGKFVKYSPSKADISTMEKHFIHLMEYCNERIPFHVDVYNIESCLCEYRKTAYGPKRIKEFTMWTTNELCDQYEDLSSQWPELDWSPYLKGFMTKGPMARDFSLNPEYFRVIVDHGLNLNTHMIYNDEPDAHELLDIDRRQTPGMKKAVADWESNYTNSQREALISQYNPVKYLKLKPKDHISWKDKNVNYGWAITWE